MPKTLTISLARVRLGRASRRLKAPQVDTDKLRQARSFLLIKKKWNKSNGQKNTLFTLQ